MYQKLDPIRATFQLSQLLSDFDGDAERQFSRSLKHIALCTGADRAYLCLWDSSEQTICTVAQWHIEQLEPMPAKPINIDGFALLDEYFAQNRGLSVIQKEAVFYDHRLIGVLCIESRDPINRLSPGEQSFVKNAAYLLAPCLSGFKVPQGGEELDVKELAESPPATSEVKEGNQSPVVLIVEDNKINQLTIMKMLERSGAVVQTADDGLHAIRACQESKFDLILMDLSMPHMDGFDTTREIITSCPFNKQTPIVAVSAHTAEETQSRCLKVGMQEFVAKPLRTQRIRELVEKYFGQAGLSRT